MTTGKPRVINVSGGIENSMSLNQLTQWCINKFGNNEVLETNVDRPFDIPWMVLDPSLVEQVWGWKPQIRIEEVLEEIARFASEKQDWCKISSL